MDWDEFRTTLGVVGALATAIVAAWTAARAAGRPARLRREEAVWRQVLEVVEGKEAILVRDLHRHTTAALIVHRLTRHPFGGSRVLTLAVGSTAGVMAGVLAAAGTANPEARDVLLGAGAADAPGAEATLPFFSVFFLILAWLFFAIELPDLARDVDARNALTRAVLFGYLRLTTDRVGSTPVLPTRTIRWPKTVASVLCLAVPLTLAALTAAGWAILDSLLSGGEGHPAVIQVAAALAIAGTLAAARSWWILVKPPPTLHATLVSEVATKPASGTECSKDGETSGAATRPRSGDGQAEVLGMVGRLLSWRRRL